MSSASGGRAIERVRELTGGLGAHSVLECVGHGESMRTAVSIVRAGGAVGRVGVPQETTIPNAQPTFYANDHHCRRPGAGSCLHARAHARRTGGPNRAGLVFDRTTNIDGVPDGYRAMNDREAIKVMIEF
jgi:threonine dehydrogenase-like Zn-dependent dehydrogenase